MTASRPTAAGLLPLLKPLLLLPALFLVLILSLSRSSSSSSSTTTTSITDALSWKPDAGGVAPLDLDVPAAGAGGQIRIRSGYRSYKEYIARQLNKTLDPRLRNIWTTRDWERKVAVFAVFFRRLQAEGLLRNGSRVLCVGARTGQEVAALRRVGVADSIGIDLVPAPSLVVKGDFHQQPFPDSSFDFEFSNVFDHALLPARFVGEVERTLRPGGVCVLHVAVRRRGDRYSANDLFSVEALVGLFRESELVVARKVDGFGLDTEVVMRKKSEQEGTPSAEQRISQPAMPCSTNRKKEPQYLFFIDYLEDHAFGCQKAPGSSPPSHTHTLFLSGFLQSATMDASFPKTNNVKLAPWEQIVLFPSSGD